MKDVFADLGFSERETKVYLALLELGETTVGPIAAKTRIQHSKVYQTIEKLIDRGLATFVIKSKTKHFQAQSPNRILSMIREKERNFQGILPELEQRQKQVQSPQTARIYEGYKAIKSMYESIIEELNKKSYYYVFAKSRNSAFKSITCLLYLSNSSLQFNNVLAFQVSYVYNCYSISFS